MRWILAAMMALTLAPAWGQEVKDESLDYKTAFYRAKEGDKPLLVLVTAQWCGPCQILKAKALPELKLKGAFSRFHFATIDYDQEPALAQNLIGERGIPQFILFEKHEDKWSRRYLIGAQTTPEIEEFLAGTAPVLVAEKQDNEGVNK